MTYPGTANTNSDEAPPAHPPRPLPRLTLLLGTDQALLDTARLELCGATQAPPPGSATLIVLDGPIPRRQLVYYEHPFCAEHPRDQAAWTRREVARAHSVGLAMVLRTHSETIVNVVAEMIAHCELRPDDAIVVLCEGGETRRLAFNGGGFVEDWPIGFFAY